MCRSGASVLLFVVLALPGDADAQNERVATALREFHAAAAGIYGDEGPAIRRALDELSRALAAADRMLRRFDTADGNAFRQAWERDPDNPALAYLARRRARLDEAGLQRSLETLRAAARSGTRRPADPFRQLGLPTEPATASPVFAHARYAEGFRLAEAGKFDAALASLRRAVTGDPLLTDSASGSERMRRAITALRNRDLRTARAALEAVVKVSPRSSEARRVLATVLSLAGERAASIRHLAIAVRLTPTDERSWTALAREQIEAGILGEAEKTLRAATAALPDSGEVRWLLGGVLERQQRNDDAAAQFEAAAGLVVVAGRAQIDRRLMAHAMAPHALMRALEAGERRVRATPDDAAAHRELAGIHTRRGDQDTALTELLIAAWLDPEDPFTQVALGHAHLAERRDAEAVEALERAVALHPSLPEAHYALAQALTRLSRRDDARRHLGTFERLRTDGIARDRRDDARAGLRKTAAAHAARGEYRAAVDVWRRLIAEEPDAAGNYVSLADILMRAGQFEAALAPLVKAAELDGVADVHRRLADVLAALDRRAESALARETYLRLRLDDFERQSRYTIAPPPP